MRKYYSQENTEAIYSLAQRDGKSLGKMKMRNHSLVPWFWEWTAVRNQRFAIRYCFSLGYKNRSKEQILLFYVQFEEIVSSGYQSYSERDKIYDGNWNQLRSWRVLRMFQFLVGMGYFCCSFSSWERVWHKVHWSLSLTTDSFTPGTEDHARWLSFIEQQHQDLKGYSW